MVYLQRALFSLVFLITYSVTSATTGQLWDSVESDLDDTIESGDPVHKPLINFLINPKDLHKAGIPESSSEEKRFGFAPMRGKRFNNDVEFPLVRNNKRARFFGLRGKRVPSLEQRLSDEDFKNILGKLLNDAYDFSTNSNDADSSLEKRFRFTALRG